MSASGGGLGADEVVDIVKSLLPDVLFNLGPDAKALLRDPTNFIREVLFGTVLAFIANFVFATTSIIDQAATAVVNPLVAVRVDLTGAVRSTGRAVYETLTAVNTTVAAGVADQLGVAAFPVLVVLGVLELALVYRAAVAALPALTDAAGAVPVVGSVLDGLATFVIEFAEGGDER